MRLNWRRRRVDQRLLPRVMLLSRPGLFKSRLVLGDLLGRGTLDQVLAQATKEKCIKVVNIMEPAHLPVHVTQK